MNRLALAVFACFAFLSVQFVAKTQEAGPTPRTVRDANGEPVADPDYWKRGHAYKVRVYIGETCIQTAGADTPRDLEELVRGLAMRHALLVRQYDADMKPVPLPQVTLTIWDTMRQQWIRPDVSAMPEGKMFLNVEVIVKVGPNSL